MRDNVRAPFIEVVAFTALHCVHCNQREIKRGWGRCCKITVHSTFPLTTGLEVWNGVLLRRAGVWVRLKYRLHFVMYPSITILDYYLRGVCRAFCPSVLPAQFPLVLFQVLLVPVQ